MISWIGSHSFAEAGLILAFLILTHIASAYIGSLSAKRHYRDRLNRTMTETSKIALETLTAASGKEMSRIKKAAAEETRVYIECSNCCGRGTLSDYSTGTHRYTCPSCKGSKMSLSPKALVEKTSISSCLACKGAGSYNYGSECKPCNGRGLARKAA